MWLNPGGLINMSRMEEFGDHTKGRFTLAGWAGTDSLDGVLWQPVTMHFIDGQF
jgi:hypothetical protein